jgi:hypothetical protein
MDVERKSLYVSVLPPESLRFTKTNQKKADNNVCPTPTGKEQRRLDRIFSVNLYHYDGEVRPFSLGFDRHYVLVILGPDF